MPPKNATDGTDASRERAKGIIRHYEEIANASRSMLDAAHRGDWDAVEDIEANCRELIRALKKALQHATLSQEEKQRRMVFLRAILSDDAQIRVRAEPWLKDLEKVLALGSRRES